MKPAVEMQVFRLSQLFSLILLYHGIDFRNFDTECLSHLQASNVQQITSDEENA